MNNPFFFLLLGIILHSLITRGKLRALNSRWTPAMKWAERLEPKEKENIQILFSIMFARELLTHKSVTKAGILTLSLAVIVLTLGVMLEWYDMIPLIPTYGPPAILACWALATLLLRALIRRGPLKKFTAKFREIMQDANLHPTIEALKRLNPAIEADILEHTQ